MKDAPIFADIHAMPAPSHRQQAGPIPQATITASSVHILQQRSRPQPPVASVPLCPCPRENGGGMRGRDDQVPS
jgi:hypothetical protein